MNVIRRLTTGIISSFEALVGQIENHEAQVTCAIRDAEAAAGRATAQLSRVTKDGTAMRRAIEENVEKARLWEERARLCAASDEAKALQCVKLRQQHLARSKSLEEQALSHGRLEKQLSADLSSVREKLSQLKTQRNLMRTRQSRAEAFLQVNSTDSRMIGEIDDIFDRWESRISACELHAEASMPSQAGDLEQEFKDAEEEAQLRAVLEAIKSGS